MNIPIVRRQTVPKKSPKKKPKLTHQPNQPSCTSDESHICLILKPHKSPKSISDEFWNPIEIPTEV